MPLAEIIQNLIHKLEAGAVPRFFRITALLLAVMALALRYLVEKRGWSGAVVRTVSTTRMIDRLCARYGL